MVSTRLRSAVGSAALALLACVGSGSAFAQSRHVDADLERRLREDEHDYDIAERSTLLGLTLSEGRKARHSFSVERGESYFGHALCTEACGDIDLIVRDAAGNVLDNDEAKGADPVLLFRAETTGNVEVVVSMKECDEEACEYGVGFHTLRGNPGGGGQAR